MQLTRLLFTVSIAGSLAGGPALGQRDQPPQSGPIGRSGSETGLLALIERSLPTRGSVLAVFEPTDSNRFARTTVGYDAATGAWFMATWQGYRGRGPSGVGIEGEASSTTPRVGASEARTPPIPIAEYAPFVLLAYLKEEPERIRSAEMRDDSSWLVTFSMPGPADRPPWVVELSAAGLPVRLYQDDPADRRETRFDYHADSPPGFPTVATHSVDAQSASYPRSLRHIEFFPDGNSSLFEPSSVAAVSVDNRAIVEIRRQASTAGFTRNEDGTWNPPDRTKVKPYSGDDLRAYRWPLVLAGLTFVVLAGYEIVRRRRGA